MPHRQADAELIGRCLDELFPARAEFAERFYLRFFHAHPEARALFVHDPVRQQKAIYAVMSMMLSCICAGRDLGEAFAGFGRAHVRAGVREDMFPAFGAAFHATMRDFLPHQDAAALARAWDGVWPELASGVIGGMRERRREAREETRLFHRVPASRDPDTLRSA